MLPGNGVKNLPYGVKNLSTPDIIPGQWRAPPGHVIRATGQQRAPPGMLAAYDCLRFQVYTWLYLAQVQVVQTETCASVTSPLWATNTGIMSNLHQRHFNYYKKPS